ncbi:unnamed protein product [Amoebophrya sp. A120]|nr:unnamed protein product [Amoebophrya sp. A120]|eukprot:GSA120T00020707001.1
MSNMSSSKRMVCRRYYFTSSQLLLTLTTFFDHGVVVRTATTADECENLGPSFVWRSDRPDDIPDKCIERTCANPFATVSGEGHPTPFLEASLSEVRHDEDTDRHWFQGCREVVENPADVDCSGLLTGRCTAEQCCKRMNLCQKKPAESDWSNTEIGLIPVYPSCADRGGAVIVDLYSSYPHSLIKCTDDMKNCPDNVCCFEEGAATQAQSSMTCQNFCENLRDKNGGSPFLAPLGSSDLLNKECANFDSTVGGWCSVKECQCGCNENDGFFLKSLRGVGYATSLADCTTETPHYALLCGNYECPAATPTPVRVVPSTYPLEARFDCSNSGDCPVADAAGVCCLENSVEVTAQGQEGSTRNCQTFCTNLPGYQGPNDADKKAARCREDKDMGWCSVRKCECVCDTDSGFAVQDDGSCSCDEERGYVAVGNQLAQTCVQRTCENPKATAGGGSTAFTAADVDVPFKDGCDPVGDGGKVVCAGGAEGKCTVTQCCKTRYLCQGYEGVCSNNFNPLKVAPSYEVLDCAASIADADAVACQPAVCCTEEDIAQDQSEKTCADFCESLADGKADGARSVFIAPAAAADKTKKCKGQAVAGDWCSVASCGCQCNAAQGYHLHANHVNSPDGKATGFSDCVRKTCANPTPALPPTSPGAQSRHYECSDLSTVPRLVPEDYNCFTSESDTECTDAKCCRTRVPVVRDNEMQVELLAGSAVASSERSDYAAANLIDDRGSADFAAALQQDSDLSFYKLLKADAAETGRTEAAGRRCPWMQIGLGAEKLVTSVHLFASNSVPRLGVLFFNVKYSDLNEDASAISLEAVKNAGSLVDAGFRVVVSSTPRDPSSWGADDACPDPEAVADVAECETVKWAGGAGERRFQRVGDGSEVIVVNEGPPGYNRGPIDQDLPRGDFRHLVAARIECKSQPGRYVIIELPGAAAGERRVLGLHEAKVYAEFATIKVSKPSSASATASSTYTHTSTPNGADRLVDGEMGTLAQTGVDQGAQKCPWLQIDLGSSQHVGHVDLYTADRTSRLAFLFFATATLALDENTFLDDSDLDTISSSLNDVGFRVLVASTPRTASAGDACPAVPGEAGASDAKLCELVSYDGGKGRDRFKNVFFDASGEKRQVSDTGGPGAEGTYDLLKARIECWGHEGQYVIIDLPDREDGSGRSLGLLEAEVAVTSGGALESVRVDKTCSGYLESYAQSREGETIPLGVEAPTPDFCIDPRGLRSYGAPATRSHKLPPEATYITVGKQYRNYCCVETCEKATVENKHCERQDIVEAFGAMWPLDPKKLEEHGGGEVVPKLPGTICFGGECTVMGCCQLRNRVGGKKEAFLVRGLILKSTLPDWQSERARNTVLAFVREKLEAVYLPGGVGDPPEGQGNFYPLMEKVSLVAGGDSLRKTARRALDDADEAASTATWNVTEYDFYFDTVLDPTRQIKALTTVELVERLNKKIGSNAQVRATKCGYFAQPGVVGTSWVDKPPVETHIKTNTTLSKWDKHEKLWWKIVFGCIVLLVVLMYLYVCYLHPLTMARLEREEKEQEMAQAASDWASHYNVQQADYTSAQGGLFGVTLSGGLPNNRGTHGGTWGGPSSFSGTAAGAGRPQSWGGPSSFAGTARGGGAGGQQSWGGPSSFAGTARGGGGAASQAQWWGGAGQYYGDGQQGSWDGQWGGVGQSWDGGGHGYAGGSRQWDWNGTAGGYTNNGQAARWNAAPQVYGNSAYHY